MIKKLILFLTICALPACDEPSGPGDDPPDSTSFGPMIVLGSGAVPERWTAEVAVAHPWAYTTTWSSRGVNRGNAVKVWNVAGNTPTLVDSIIIQNAGTTSDVQISDDGTLLVVSLEFSGDDGIAIFDRSVPERPTLIRRYSNENTRQGVHTVKLGRVNGRHYAFLSLDPRGPLAPAKLAIVDITNPAVPMEVFAQPMGNPFVHDVFVRDGVLFTALWDDGLSIWDIGGAGRNGTPANPVLLGNVRTTGGEAHNVWWFHNPNDGSKRYAFVGEEGPSNIGGFSRASGDVHVVDVSNLSAPREVAVYRPDSTTTTTGLMAGAHNFTMDESSEILYAAFYNGGVRAIDVRGDLSSCSAAHKTPEGLCDLRLMGREVGRVLNVGPPKFIWGVARAGTMLYASDMPNGIHKIDISGLQR